MTLIDSSTITTTTSALGAIFRDALDQHAARIERNRAANEKMHVEFFCGYCHAIDIELVNEDVLITSIAA